ncbi:MAG: hypothetical protein HUU29_14630 [Planctomycetaceae bacterium]|nr:hypothetical protein [Planctomycetaceae bacterium]
MGTKLFWNIARRTIVAAILLGASVTSLAAGPATFPHVGQVSGDSVRLRGGPSTQHSTLEVLKKGDKLVVVSEKDGWFEVRLPQSCPCWIAEQLLKDNGDGTASVTGDNVNLRASADTKQYPIGQVNRGTVSLVRGDDGNTVKQGGYVRIVPPEQARAWISKEFIAATDEPVETVTPPVTTASGDAKSAAGTPNDERAAFQELDKIFLEELAKPTEKRDLTKAAELYQQYASFAKNEEIRKKAQHRIDLLKRTDAKIREVIEAAETKAKEAQKADAERQAQIADVLNKDANAEPIAYLAVGIVKSHGRDAKTPASHMIVDDTGDVLYYVRWEKGNLDLVLDKRVGFTGETKNYEDWDKPVIVIDRCEEIAMAEASVSR